MALPAIPALAQRADSVTAPAAPAAPAALDALVAFANGRTALAQANTLAQDARQALLDANRTRRTLLALRAGQAPEGETPQALAQRIEQLQQDGAALRARADAARQVATRHFADGLGAGWPAWVTDREPLTMDTGLRRFMAHNAQVRSVHPNMPAPPAAASAARAPGDTMAQQFPMLASQNPPADLDIGSSQLSREQQVFAHIEVHPDAGDAPGNVAAVPLNRMHRWRLVVSDLAGAPVAGARIGVAGHMPGHVHGLPTQPRVTQELAPGVYLVEGLKFQMEGWWVMQFEIQPAGPVPSADNVAFNLVF